MQGNWKRGWISTAAIVTSAALGSEQRERLVSKDSRPRSNCHFTKRLRILRFGALADVALTLLRLMSNGSETVDRIGRRRVDHPLGCEKKCQLAESRRRSAEGWALVRDFWWVGLAPIDRRRYIAVLEAPAAVLVSMCRSGCVKPVRSGRWSSFGSPKTGASRRRRGGRAMIEVAFVEAADQWNRSWPPALRKGSIDRVARNKRLDERGSRRRCAPAGS